MFFFVFLIIIITIIIIIIIIINIIISSIIIILPFLLRRIVACIRRAPFCPTCAELVEVVERRVDILVDLAVDRESCFSIVALCWGTRTAPDCLGGGRALAS